MPNRNLSLQYNSLLSRQAWVSAECRVVVPNAIYALTLTGPSIRLQFLAPPDPGPVAHELLSTPVLSRMSRNEAEALAYSACLGRIARYGAWTLERGEG